MMITAMFSLAACERGTQDDSGKGRNYFFTSVISGSPETLDPQLSRNDSSVQIIANIFQGLYRISDGGRVEPAMAKECTVSGDGLVWEFDLRDDIKWYGKDGFSAECTAEDFVFGLRRLFDPELASGRAAEYYCINNAREVNEGALPPEELGAEAVDKYRLRITLSEQRTDLRALLAAAPAMPCNEEYYLLTEGQYGLVGDWVGSNSDFYVSRWHYDKWVKDGNFIELRRNPLNAEVLETAPRGVTLNINTDDYELFLDGKAELCRSADSDEIFRLSGKSGYTTYSTAVWGIMFSSGGHFDNAGLRIALGGCVKGGFDENIYSLADRLVPDGITIGGSDYRKLAGYPERSVYSEEELTERGIRAMRELEDGALTGIKLLIPEGVAVRQQLGVIIQEWQKKFGVYCLISELPYPEYYSALSAGNFDIALVRLGGSASGAVSYMNVFTSGSPENYAHINNRKLESIIHDALTAENESSAARYCLEAEQLVLDNSWFAPLCFEKEHIFFASGVEGVEYDPFSGTFIFRKSLKK